MKTVFVAGHRGMVGAAIVKQLEKRENVTVITRTRAELDLTSQQAVSTFFADNNISIWSLKSDTYDEGNELKMRCELEFNIPVDVDIDQFKISFENLSHVLNVDYIFRRIR